MSRMRHVRLDTPGCIHAIGRLSKKDSGKSRPITDCSRPRESLLNDYIKPALHSFRINSVDAAIMEPPKNKSNCAVNRSHKTAHKSIELHWNKSKEGQRYRKCSFTSVSPKKEVHSNSYPVADFRKDGTHVLLTIKHSKIFRNHREVGKGIPQNRRISWRREKVLTSLALIERILISVISKMGVAKIILGYSLISQQIFTGE